MTTDVALGTAEADVAPGRHAVDEQAHETAGDRRQPDKQNEGQQVGVTHGQNLVSAEANTKEQ